MTATETTETGTETTIRWLNDEEACAEYLPTGPVVRPTVVRFAIVGLGVEPSRDDWRGISDGAERAVWGTLPPA